LKDDICKGFVLASQNKEHKRVIFVDELAYTH